ncbi:MAG: lipopolysaccharide biosynthesis protein [Hamadaea sp.]|nr:lipopolysaccharide biosynthesis protein [Hamadaea sp.]NUT06235.1 lipopolysaccharide biosynthesis protein [Hamadaea sp.]
MDLSDYLGLVRRHWWVVLLLTAVGVAGAAAVTRTLPREYVSSTSVLVQPSGGDANAAGGRTKGEINLDTEAQLVRSTQVAATAAELLRTKADPRELARGVSVEVPANTTVLQIKYAARTPELAQAGSHAFAEAYLRSREENAHYDLDTQIKALNAKLKQLSAQLGQVITKLGKLSGDAPNRPTLDSQRTTLQTQINQLNGKLNGLSTTAVSAGRIISDAGLPNRPRKPDLKINLAGGAVLGALLGLLAAALRHRLDRRVRRAGDVWRRADVPVLAEVTGRAKPRLDDVFPPYGSGGRIFNRLRNEVVAAIAAVVPPTDDTRGRAVVVTGASRGPSATLVAANLATALARTGSEVVLVGAHQPDLLVGVAPLAGMVGVQPTPGLSDVICGRVALSTALQRAPRTPHLRVLATGATASAAGLLQSQALRDILAHLRTQCDYLIIEAPSTEASADAQSLAGVADAAIVAIELRRTRYPQVADAAEQLRRVGTVLLGSVVVPRLKPFVPTPAPAPATPPSAALVEDTQHFQRLDDAKLAELDAAAPATAPAPAAAAERSVA